MLWPVMHRFGWYCMLWSPFCLLQEHFRQVIWGKTQKWQLPTSFLAFPAVHKCFKCHLVCFYYSHVSAHGLHNANHYVCAVVCIFKRGATCLFKNAFQRYSYENVQNIIGKVLLDCISILVSEYFHVWQEEKNLS